jgi:competence protein ComEA
MSNRVQLTPQVLLLVSAVVSFIAVIAFYIAILRPSEGDLIIRMDPTALEVAVESRGEVQNPGLYRLPEGARVGDLIEAAGGASPDADLSSINLAGRLQDQGQIVIPERGKPTAVAEIDASPVAPSISVTFRIDINRASQPELESLPGIGPVLAARIIQHRIENGPFTTVDQLTEVEGISTSLVEEIRSLVTAGQ